MIICFLHRISHDEVIRTTYLQVPLSELCMDTFAASLLYIELHFAYPTNRCNRRAHVKHAGPLVFSTAMLFVAKASCLEWSHEALARRISVHY
jgi:hypothetical protein